jgi:hypothetical protein
MHWVDKFYMYEALLFRNISKISESLSYFLFLPCLHEISIPWLVSFLVFFGGGTGVWASCLLGRRSYHLSHSSSLLS